MKTSVTSQLIAVLLLQIFLPMINAQDENPSQPLDRLYHHMVTHPPTNQVFLFGGVPGHGTNNYDDYWSFDLTARRWTYLGKYRAAIYVNPLGTRTLVPAFCSAWDRESDRMIFFNLAMKTWAFDPVSNTWEQMSPAVYPSARCGQNMVYDEESDRVILFGGFQCKSLSGPFFNDVWAYDYNTDTWEEMSPAEAPIERAYAQMVYNPKSDRAMLWGGRDLDGYFPDNSIWEFDYNSDTWSEIAFEKGPSKPYAYSEMVYDPANDELFVYGGGYLTGTFIGRILDSTWIYHCADTTWTNISVEGGPGTVSDHAMAFLPGEEELILFGGESSDWMYEDVMLKGTWIMDYVNKSWYEVPFAFAGNDAMLCGPDVDGRLLGGTPTAWGGVEPFNYSWGAEGLLNGEPVDVSDLLDDPTSPNPALISRADSVSFYLEVSDSNGTVAYDTVRLTVSSLSVCQEVWEEEFFKGDSVQLDHCVVGGMEPLSFQWQPVEFLSDSSASNPWASTDSVTMTFELVVTDTLGCEVTSTFTVQYSTVGMEHKSKVESSVTVSSVIESTGTRLLIENRLPERLNVDILGISGRLMEQFTLPPGSYERHLSGYRSGLYLYRITSHKTLIGTGKLVIQ